MKLKSIVALLGLSASIGAFAVPLAPNSPAPSTIGASPSGEGSLQSIADSVVRLRPHQRQRPGRARPASSRRRRRASRPAFRRWWRSSPRTRRRQSFGIWFGTDTSNIASYNMLARRRSGARLRRHRRSPATRSRVGTGGAACRHDRTTAAPSTTPGSTPDAFGFFFRPSAERPDVLLARSAERADPARTDRVDRASRTARRPTGCSPYEDGTDFDYNDMAVKVESITARAGARNLRADARRPGRHGLRRASPQIPLRALGAVAPAPDHERTSVRSFFAADARAGAPLRALAIRLVVLDEVVLLARRRAPGLHRRQRRGCARRSADATAPSGSA